MSKLTYLKIRKRNSKEYRFRKIVRKRRILRGEKRESEQDKSA